MELSKTQVSLLKTIQRKRKRGDIGIIAEKTGLSSPYVSLVLNPDEDYWDEKIISEEIELINEREQNAKELSQKLTA